NDGAPKTRHALHAQDAPDRARRVNIAIGLEDAVRSHRLRVHTRCDSVGTRGVNVSDEDGGTGVRQVLRERRADSARTLDEDSSSLELIRPEDVREAGADAVKNADRRGRRGMTGAARFNGATKD